MNVRCDCGHHSAYHAVDGCFHTKPGWNSPGRCGCPAAVGRELVATVVRYDSISLDAPPRERRAVGA
jgi:hypothetical protein